MTILLIIQIGVENKSCPLSAPGPGFTFAFRQLEHLSISRKQYAGHPVLQR